MSRPMNDNPKSTKKIFFEAVEQHAPDDWPAFLDRACAGRPHVRCEDVKLLNAHAEFTITRDPQADGNADLNTDVIFEPPRGAEQPGAVIGAYKLLEEIGEGGFGVVFLAEQTQPVRRNVALKVLKPGMD